MSTILYLVAGYAIAVLFPVPILSQAIINGWAALGEKIKNWKQ